MKLAFLISASKDPVHLKRLIDSLPKDSEFYVHIDHKSCITAFTKLIDDPRVFFLPERVSVVPDSILEVKCQVELLRAAIVEGHADYFILIDGTDYPLWSNNRIKAFFEQARAEHREILQGISMLHQGKASEPYQIFHFLADEPWRKGSLKARLRDALNKAVAATHLSKSLKIHCPEKTYTLYKGAPCWGITPELALSIVTEWDENDHLVNYFRTSFRPSETFVPTVAFNSAYASRCILSEGKYQGLTTLTPLTYIQCAPASKELTEADLDTVMQSGKMFCRKVISGKGNLLMKRIDKIRAQTSDSTEE